MSASGIGTIKSAVALRDEDSRKDLRCVHVPTYIIHGDKDLIVSSELAELQHKGIPGIKPKWFYDLPGIILPSLGMGMFGLIAIVNML